MDNTSDRTIQIVSVSVSLFMVKPCVDKEWEAIIPRRPK